MYVLECLSAAGYACTTYVISKSEKYGAAARRWRLYFLAIRIPTAIANNIARKAEVFAAITDMTAAMQIGCGSPGQFVGSSMGFHDPIAAPAPVNDAKRQKKQAKVMWRCSKLIIHIDVPPPSNNSEIISSISLK